MKKIAAFALAALLLLGLCLPAAAVEPGSMEYLTELITGAVREMRSELDLSGLTYSKAAVDEVIRQVERDPALFWYRTVTTWYYPNGLVTKLEFSYLEGITRDDLAAFDAAADAAMRCVIPGMTAVQKALVLHDYLATHVVYDYENYLNGTVPPLSSTAYGALVLGTAVCQGYAKAYCLLLSRCGIPSVYVSSSAMNHGWTMVQLGGSWYHVDVTWDDPVPDTPGSARHQYFLLSDAAISDAEHRHYGWTADHVCDSTSCDANVFWTELNTPVPFTDTDTYWMLHEAGDHAEQSISLIRRSWSTGEYEVVSTIRDFWPVWGRSGWFWNDAYSGLVLWDSRLFFNDTLHVYAYDPADKTLDTVYTYEGGEGYLYGLVAGGTSLQYLLKQDPNEDDGVLCPLSLTQKYPSGPFMDVVRGDYYYDAVQWAFEQDITTGTGDGLFSPADACTRAQVVTFLWRALGRPAPLSAENPFADVPDDAYYRDAVLWAAEQGLVNGTGTDAETGRPLFSPALSCSYAHILTLLWRCCTGSDASSYGSWYAEALDWAAGQALLTDTAPGADAAQVSAFCPRRDIVTYLWRAMGTEGGTPDPQP